jgi:fatty-acyl-CoA synthase
MRGTDRPGVRAWISATTLGDLLDQRAERHPEDEAVVFDGDRATFGDLGTRAQRLARGLAGLGVSAGDRVGLLVPASVDLMALMFAVAKIGATAVPINARFKQVELAGIVTHSGMRVLVAAAESEALIRAVAPDRASAPELEHVVLLGTGPHSGTPAVDGPRWIGLAELADAEVSDEQVWTAQASVRVRDTAMLVYTSGTTSAPKGAMLSHEALTRLAAGIGERLRLTSEDRVWTAIPLFHGGGITFALSSLTARATFVHPGLFSPTTALEILAGERVTVALAAFETIWMPVLDRPDFGEFDLSRIRAVMAVGVPERLRDMASRLPKAAHVSCVAMTESSAFLTLGELDDPVETFATTGGLPMPGMLCRVVDPETGADQPPGTPGELLFRGPNTFDGYFRDPEATAAAFDDGGWFHTGDLVVADERGRLTFRSRLKDMLKVGGENVAAAEVEGYLLGHPDVDLVAVVAAPDAYYVQVPAAFVQLRPGAEVGEQELIDFCLGRIATYRVPRYVRFLTSEQWPMSGTKIKKVVLREWIERELAQRGITEAPRLSPRSNEPRTS